jgi:hypothetical protein
MPDHLSIEILGVLRGTADGPIAIGALGLIVLGVLLAPLCRLRPTRLMPWNSINRRFDWLSASRKSFRTTIRVDKAPVAERDATPYMFQAPLSLHQINENLCSGL